MYAGKTFKALIDSGAALLLVYTSIYNMVEDQYKTQILTTAVHLKTALGSTMSSLGKATLHLLIANFQVFPYLHHMLQISDTDILFGIDTQKRYSLSYSWDADKQLFIQREESFLSYSRNCEQQHNNAVVKSPLNVTQD